MDGVPLSPRRAPMRPDRSTEPPPTPPSLVSPSSDPHDPRLRALVGEVSRRLRGVCAEMPPEAFDALVLDIARFHLRWQDREGRPQG